MDFIKFISKNLGVVVLFGLIFFGGLFFGKSCGKTEQMEESLTVYEKFRFHKPRTIDSMSIFEKFKLRFPEPPVRYIEVVTLPGEVLRDTVYMVYGMHCGILYFSDINGIITFDWFSTFYDEGQDSTITTLGHEPGIKKANPRNNVELIPTGDAKKPFLVVEHKFSRTFTREINLQIGSNVNFKKVLARGDGRLYIFDKFFLSLEGNVWYKRDPEPYEDPFGNEVLGLIGIRF